MGFGMILEMKYELVGYVSSLQIDSDNSGASVDLILGHESFGAKIVNSIPFPVQHFNELKLKKDAQLKITIETIP